MVNVYVCSVPYCQRKTSEKDLTFHRFPKCSTRRQEWVTKCHITKNISTKSFVCSSHFVKEDYIPSNGTRKLLKPSSVPYYDPQSTSRVRETVENTCEEIPFKKTKFSPSILGRSKKKNNVSVEAKRTVSNEMSGSEGCHEAASYSNPRGEHDQVSIQVPESTVTIPDREHGDATPSNNSSDLRDTSVSSDQALPNSENSDDFSQDINELHIQCDHESIFDAESFDFESEPQDESDEARMEAIEELQEMSGDIGEENVNIVKERGTKFEQNFSECKRDNLMNLIRSDEDLIAFTGISSQLLDSLTNAVLLGESEAYQKKFTLSVRERIVLCLCKLRLNLSFRCLSVLFGINRKTCSSNFAYMVQVLSLILEQFVIWPTRQQCRHNMPKCFENFSKTRIVLDCTEIPVEKPHCLKCRLRWYSHYKGCETVKLLIGMTASGLISFVSDSYGGRTSDKAIFNQSGLLDKLDPTLDAIMVDKGFDVELECLQAHIQLIMPPKLGKRAQLSAEEGGMTRSIASARVHVERVIQRMKLWKILKDKITLPMLPHIDNITKIIAGLVNLKSPLLTDDKF